MYFKQLNGAGCSITCHWIEYSFPKYSDGNILRESNDKVDPADVDVIDDRGVICATKRECGRRQ